MNKWEFVALDTFRLRVPGGWLYRYSPNDEMFTMSFVPNPPLLHVKGEGDTLYGPPRECDRHD